MAAPPLVEQRTSFPVVAGQEQGIAPELVDPPALLRAHNAVYDRQGELSKRRGWATFSEGTSDGSTLPLCERLAKRGDEVVWIGEQHTAKCASRGQLKLHGRLPAESAAEDPAPDWLPKGPIPRFNVEKLCEIPLNRPGEKVWYVDSAVAGDLIAGKWARGVLLAVWSIGPVDQGTLHAVAIDIATGTVISDKVLTFTSHQVQYVRVVACKHVNEWFFHVFYSEGGDTSQTVIYCATIPAATPWAPQTPYGFIAETNVYDVCVTAPTKYSNDAWDFEPRLFVVWASHADSVLHASFYTCENNGMLANRANSTYTMSWFSPSSYIFDQQMQVVCDPEGRHLAAHFVAISANGSGYLNALVQWNAGDFSARSLGVYGATTVDAMPNSTGTENGGCQIGWAGELTFNALVRHDNWWLSFVQDQTQSAIANICMRWTQADAKAAINVSVRGATYAYRPYSRHFNYRGQGYIIAIRGFSVDAVQLEVEAFQRYLVESPIAPQANARMLAGEISFSDVAFSVELTRGRSSVTESRYEPGRFFFVTPTVSLDGLEHRLSVMSISASDPQRFGACEIGGGLYFATGIPWCYDGRLGHELGFAHRPQHPNTSNGEILGGVSNNTYDTYQNPGSYWLAMVWENVDGLGRMSRSAPSICGPITVTADQRLTIEWQTLGYTSHGALRPVAYVSSDDGITYVRSVQVIPHIPGATSAALGVILDPDMIGLSTSPTLYTSDGMLENAPLPPMRFACEWQGRVWFANGRDVWFSKEVIDGEEPSFNEALSFKLPVACSGLASLDDRLLMFGREAIYWTSGDGPTDTGEGGTFAQPQRVPSDFGCIDARSIVRTEKGVCFQSRRGIEIIERGLGTRLISGGVDRLLREDGYSQIVAANFDPEAQIVRFIAVAGSNSVVLCWHTLWELWTTASVPVVSATLGRTSVPAGLVHAFESNWMALNDAPSFEETPLCAIAREYRPGDANLSNIWMDGLTGSGHWYQTDIETANLKLDGLTGYVRVWRAHVLLKEMNEFCGIEFAYAIDYSYSAASTPRRWVTASQIAAGLTKSANHRQFGIHIDKQQCTAIRFIVRDLQYDDESGTQQTSQYTKMTFVGFGLLWGQKPGTGRGREGSKK
jgi:hypothetical protein